MFINLSLHIVTFPAFVPARESSFLALMSIFPLAKCLGAIN